MIDSCHVIIDSPSRPQTLWELLKNKTEKLPVDLLSLSYYPSLGNELNSQIARLEHSMITVVEKMIWVVVLAKILSTPLWSSRFSLYYIVH